MEFFGYIFDFSIEFLNKFIFSKKININNKILK